jgi:hypothetical protein
MCDGLPVCITQEEIITSSKHLTGQVVWMHLTQKRVVHEHTHNVFKVQQLLIVREWFHTVCVCVQHHDCHAGMLLLGLPLCDARVNGFVVSFVAVSFLLHGVRDTHYVTAHVDVAGMVFEFFVHTSPSIGDIAIHYIMHRRHYIGIVAFSRCFVLVCGCDACLHERISDAP